MKRLTSQRWLAFVSVATAMQSVMVGANAAFNGSQSQESARPGLSDPATTIYQTPRITIYQTATVHVTGPSPTSFHYATSTNHNFSGCSKSCSLDASGMAVYYNSWTKCLGTALIGRVHYLIDSVNNKTVTSTSYAERVEYRLGAAYEVSHGSDLAASGVGILTRKDVNSAGSVTHVDGTDTMTYPTGHNILPKFYAWHGTLPYTTNGTVACATANSADVVPWVDRFGETFFATGATLFPTVKNLPTASVYSLDQQDPKGWAYCYDLGDREVLGEEFVSLFTGDMFSKVQHSCAADYGEVGPVRVVEEAQFLLDETTSYVQHTKTESSAVTQSHITESSRTSASVLVDPVRLLDSTATQIPSTAEEDHDVRSTTAESTQLDVSHTISEVGSIQTAHNLPSAQTTRPTLSSEKSAASLEASPTLIQEAIHSDSADSQGSVVPTTSTTEEQIASHLAPTVAGDASVLPGSEALASSEAIVSSTNVRFDILNSLIQDIVQTQSSSSDGTFCAADLVVGSHTSTLSTTKGIGGYVWAGIADLLPAVSVSASSASDPPTGIPSTSLDLLDPLVSPVTSISEAADSDDGITVEGSAIESTIAPDSSSTRTKNADDDLEGSSTMSNTNAGTTSQVEPTAVSSSPSDQQGQSSENKVGPSVVTPSVGIWILSLLIFVLL